MTGPPSWERCEQLEVALAERTRERDILEVGKALRTRQAERAENALAEAVGAFKEISRMRDWGEGASAATVADAFLGAQEKP